MTMMAVLAQGIQMVLVLALAPGLTGLVRLVKARLVGRRGPGLIQPYRDLMRLFRKDAVLADNASWLFRNTPYLVFAVVWFAATLVPTFTTLLPLGPSADFIAVVAFLGSARFFTALAGMDIGTSFGGIGASREMMIGSLAEPAVLMVIFTISLLVHSTSLTQIAEYIVVSAVGIRVSLVMALISLIIVAIAENGRIPVDNPSTHLELTMVHEAMVLEYSGRHLALIEAAAMVRLQLFMSLIICVFAPYGMAMKNDTPGTLLVGIGLYGAKLFCGAVALGLFETSIAKMRVFRVGEFLGSALLLSILAMIYLYISRAL
ncbi:MAG: NADH-quinone oxidoreductase subunit H [Alphaproteobacteria bacterium]|nr:NADH-quinone oxidoreductase subunit H [Alphaproteobacteria bacterium]